MLSSLLSVSYQAEASQAKPYRAVVCFSIFTFRCCWQSCFYSSFLFQVTFFRLCFYRLLPMWICWSYLICCEFYSLLLRIERYRTGIVVRFFVLNHDLLLHPCFDSVFFSRTVYCCLFTVFWRILGYTLSRYLFVEWWFFLPLLLDQQIRIFRPNRCVQLLKNDPSKNIYTALAHIPNRYKESGRGGDIPKGIVDCDTKYTHNTRNDQDQRHNSICTQHCIHCEWNECEHCSQV